MRAPGAASGGRGYEPRPPYPLSEAEARYASPPRGTQDRPRWWVLGALTAVSFLLLLQDTAVSVALPAIRSDLGSGLSELEWIVNAYTLSLAVLMLPAGRIADLRGGRATFLWGLAAFMGASLLSGIATSGTVLVVARAAQGAGAALLATAALALISTIFDERERGSALGIWAGASAVGLGLGPLVGAVLSEGFGWASIFLINVPLGAGAFFAAHRLLPRVQRPLPLTQIRGSLPSLVTSAAALLALLLAFSQATGSRWTSASVIALLAVAATAAAIFVRIERRAVTPLLDRSLLAAPRFVGANLVSLLSTAVMCNLFFFLALYMQIALGYSALSAGAMLLPLTGLIVVSAPLAGRMSDKLGRRPLVVAGMLLLALALTLLSRLQLDTGPTKTLLWLGLAGLGIGLSTTPATAAALDDIPSEQAGLAAGFLNTSRAVGLSLGIATMGAVLSSGTVDVLAGGGRAGSAFVAGLSTALLINAGVAIFTALLGALMLRGPAPGSTPAAALARPRPDASRNLQVSFTTVSRPGATLALDSDLATPPSNRPGPDTSPG